MNEQTDPDPHWAEQPPGDPVMIFWIMGICVVAIFGPAWVAAVMCVAVLGGVRANSLLTRLLRWLSSIVGD